MKKIIYFVVALFLNLGCSTQNFITSSQYARLPYEQKFTFHATRANPSSMEVINIANSLPGGRGGNQLFQLSEGNVVELTSEQLRVDLPYFGQSYTARGLYTSRNTGFRYITKDFSIEPQQASDRIIYIIQPKDSKHFGTLIRLEVFPNGRAVLSLNSMDKMAISYEGYLSIP